MNKRLHAIFVAFVLLWMNGTGHASAYTPFFANYGPKEYGAANQNWSLAQDAWGYLYAGNNSCLLRFNGMSWDRIYPFGEDRKAIVRSLYADSGSGRVYVGSFREFGYFTYDATGTVMYTSLSDKIKGTPDLGNDEIWYIDRVGDTVFFVYFGTCYLYDLKTGEISVNRGRTSYYYKLDGCLFLGDGASVRRFTGASASYEIVELQEEVPGTVLKRFAAGNGKQILVTEEKGLYLDAAGNVKRIDATGEDWGVANRAIQCRDGTVIVGFLAKGVRAFGADGALLWHLDMENGLIDNTVLALLEDRCGNVWVALDKGIAVVYKGGDSLLPLAHPDPGKITAALMDGRDMYVGSNKGLFRMSLSDDLQEVLHIHEYDIHKQVWSLSERDRQIFVGENGQSFLVQGDRISALSSAPGGTAPVPVWTSEGQELLLQGSFASLYVYEKDASGNWRERNPVEGFLRPVKHLEVDYLGNVWLEHMYEGLYKLTLSSDFRKVASEVVYPGFHRHVCKMGGRVLFHGENGFYRYDDLSGEIIPFDAVNRALGDFRSCSKVIPAGENRYWLLNQDRGILVRYAQDTVDLLDHLDLSVYGVSLVRDFETVVPLGGTEYLFGVGEGFLVHDCAASDTGAVSPRLFLREAAYSRQGKVQRCELQAESLLLPNQSDLTLKLSISGLKFPKMVQISCRLQNYDYAETAMGEDLTATYRHLTRGDYLFTAIIRDGLGNSLVSLSLPVSVRPGFGASVPAICLYVLLSLLLVWSGWRAVRRLLNRQRKQLESENAKALMELRNEQLESSLLLKSKELATYSLMEAQRNRVLQKLKDALNRMRFKERATISKRDYDTLMRTIKEGEFTEDNWNLFYTNFDLIHQSFFRNLKRDHPDLTSNDLRLCAYLRLNLSTKEIADITGITVKGAEGAKYRLRKKLGVSSNVPLNEFLLGSDKL